MTVEISVSADIEKVSRDLRRFRRHIPFATALALTMTAKKAQSEVRDEMKRKLDRPKAFTLSGTFVKPADKRGFPIKATIGFKDFAAKGTPAAKYLGPQIAGGRRRHKRFERALIAAGIMRSNEYAVPGDDMRLDRYGNLPRGQISKMLSQLKASPDSQQNATGSVRSKKSRRTRAYFYKRSFRGVFVRTGKRAFTVFIKFVKAPRFRKRLPFDRVVDQTVRFRFPLEFRRAILRAVRTAR